MSVRLIVPSKEYLSSYFEAREEFQKQEPLPFDIAVPGEIPPEPEKILEIYANRRQGIGLPKGCVPDSTFWLVDGPDGEKFIGLGNIRHRLNKNLKIMGGHIGYAIRPTLRNRGYATLLLSFLLKEAAALGLREVLLTCNALNAASSRVMEKNGGVHVATIDHEVDGRPRRTRHYLILTNEHL